jgi:hypothetical protein
LGKQGLHFDAGHRHGRLDALQRRRIGYPQPLVIARAQAAAVKLCLDLRARAMHQHEAHTEGCQQVAVIGKRLGQFASRHLAAKTEHEGLAAKGMDIGCRSPHPGHETLGKMVCLPGGRHREGIVTLVSGTAGAAGVAF